MTISLASLAQGLLRHAAVAGALALSLAVLPAAAAPVTGDEACQAYFAAIGSPSPMRRATKLQEDVQVGCVAQPGDGNVTDTIDAGSPKPNQTFDIIELTSGYSAAGRCDPGPYGTHEVQQTNGRNASVRLTTTCNYRAIGGSGTGRYCAKCYILRLKYRRAR